MAHVTGTDVESGEDSSTIITIIAGKGSPKRTFAVPKGILCSHSRFFRAALNRQHGWLESQTNTVKPPTEEPDTVAMFCHYISTGNVLGYYSSRLDPVMVVDSLALVKLWIFGDAYFVPELQNKATSIWLDRAIALARDGRYYGMLREMNRTCQYVRWKTLEGIRLRSAGALLQHHVTSTTEHQEQEFRRLWEKSSFVAKE